MTQNCKLTWQVLLELLRKRDRVLLKDVCHLVCTILSPCAHETIFVDFQHSVSICFHLESSSDCYNVPYHSCSMKKILNSCKYMCDHASYVFKLPYKQ